jgi:hypothetical protein
MYYNGSSKFDAGCPCTHPFYGVSGKNYFPRGAGKALALTDGVKIPKLAQLNRHKELNYFQSLQTEHFDILYIRKF